MIRQQRDVTGPVPERGHFDRDHVDPPEEVGPKAAGGHERGEVFVGGQDDAGVDGVGLPAAHRLEPQVLQHAQQFHLHGRGCGGNLVKKDRAAIGLQELAVPVGGGTGEGTGDMAKEFAFEERFTEATAGHLDEPFSAAAAAAVDLASQQRLSGAALARDE